MNETEANQRYQEIFSADRIERWKSWKRYCNTEGRLPEGCDHPLARIPEKKKCWKGGMKTEAGYRMVLVPDHPKALRTGGYVREHVLVAEMALGRFLPDGAIVHHNDENKLNNYSDDNLVICESVAHHLIIHRRMRALRECGNSDWLWCPICQKWDAKENLVMRYYDKNKTVGRGRHKACEKAHSSAQHQQRKAAKLFVALPSIAAHCP